MRKRLTAATLQEQTRMASSLMAADLGIRLLGQGATDNEVHRVASIFLNHLPQAGLQEVYKVTARVAAESGEDFPAIDSQESPQPESTDTQQYVAEHEVTPDHAVADVAMNERAPTQDPKASKQACSGMDKKVKAEMGDNGGGLITGEEVEGDSVKPDFLGENVESPPMPPQEDESEQDIDFEMSDTPDENMQDKQKPEIRDPDETEEDSDEDHVDSDEGSFDEDEDDIFDGLEEDGDDEGFLDDPEDFSDDSDDFALDDLDSLGDLGADEDDLGIDEVEDLHRQVPSGAEASKKSASRTAKKNETFAGWDDVLEPKKSRTASNFKPSRVRRASAQNSRSDVDALFDVPDHDSVMREFRF